MEQGSWLDYGMFLQNIMVAARGRGLDTCPQAAFTQYHRIIGCRKTKPWCAAWRSVLRICRKSKIL
jgi:nitroreductase